MNLKQIFLAVARTTPPSLVVTAGMAIGAAACHANGVDDMAKVLAAGAAITAVICACHVAKDPAP